MELSFFFPWEVALTEWLQAHMGAAAVTLASLISMLGEQLPVVGIIGFLYWCYDKEYGRFLGVNLAAATVFNAMVKNMVFRRRPYCDHPSIRCLKPVEPKADIYDLAAQGYSFPSGHSSTAVTAYGSLALCRPRPLLKLAAVLLPLLVGLSRVCLGVHYPTDVLAGWLLGLLVTFLVGALQKRLRRLPLYLILLLAGLPGWFFCRSTDFYSSYGLMLGLFASVLFEARFVRFENTRCVPRAILRLAAGIGLFLGLNALLKLPFRPEFLASVSFGARLVRTLRYALAAFAVMGLYPMLFRQTDRLWKREKTSG